ncbi:MAG: OsmC family protein [Cyclobacteriaceae bacterium]
MDIQLTRNNESVHLTATNSDGNEVNLDGSPSIGGKGLGARPMELVLMGLGGCSSMDVLSILEKMKVKLESYDVKVHADRDTDAVPSLFTDIHVEYIITGQEKDRAKIEKAINLSMDKYCSVTKILESTAKITHSLTLNN